MTASIYLTRTCVLVPRPHGAYLLALTGAGNDAAQITVSELPKIIAALEALQARHALSTHFSTSTLEAI